MCKWNKYGDTRIDPCMRRKIDFLKFVLRKSGFQIKACCCGHGKYPETIVIKLLGVGYYYELNSGKYIPRKKRFYKRDKKNHYYIPEVSKPI